jgi:serine phosphatase RsbU (regulator of sigma subunit)
MPSLFRKPVEAQVFREPAPPKIPSLQRSDLAAAYRGPRVGGDFFESVQASHDRMVFVLLDIAGSRGPALDIAAAVQDGLRKLVPDMFSDADLNETDAVTELVLQLNNIILEAAQGVRCSPGFVACYNEVLGMLSYINAGYIPALLLHDGKIDVLGASGLPLGLFSHATHECQVSVLSDDSRLLLASRGLLEVRARGEEFGLDRLKQTFQRLAHKNARDTCAGVLKDVEHFVEQQQQRRFFRLWDFHPKAEGDALGANDITTVVLVRAAARARAAAR